jgi:proteic killer suppression protein
MIKSFADKQTYELFTTGTTRRLSANLMKRAVRHLEYIHHATCLEDLKVPPSNHLHKLSADRDGQYAISVNAQWRICFRFVAGNAYEVELTDYH